ncbi:MAG: ABC transporter ATP-binding protein [Clostridia bacterium]|nr:ABC transporter ATP-binding protein [Clostridia bacterium]
MEKDLIKVNNLSIKFNTKLGYVSAVDDISFNIKEKEIFALVGESGSGKSTTAYALMNLINARNSIKKGEILFKGKDILKLNEREMTKIRGKEIAMIFQNPLDSLNPIYTAGSQVYEAIALDKVEKREAWNRVINIFKEVRLSDPEQRIKSYPHELSGGMRQRVMIGMMLSRRPELLIADEPTTALDVTIQSQILDIIKELKSKFNTSVLVITHDFGIVAEIADRVGVMYAGKILEIGDVYQIFENPLHPYTQLLMKSLPRITKKEGRLQTIEGSVPNLTDDIKGCRFNNRCPYSLDACKGEDSEMLEIEKGHYVACHLVVKEK